MDDIATATTREEAINFLDRYAVQQRSSVKKRKLAPNTGVIKSYMLETEQSDANVHGLFADSLLRITDLDEGFFRFTLANQSYGFIEIVNDRYLMVHTIQESKEADKAIKRLVLNSSQLDFVWLSGHYLNVLWDAVIKDQYPQRYVKMQFEYNDVFRQEAFLGSKPEQDEFYTSYDRDEEEIDEEELHRQSNLSIGMTAGKVAGVLPNLQLTLEDFKVMTRLRMPSGLTSAGGYDFWHWGKVTHRSSSFRDGRAQATSGSVVVSDAIY